MTIDTGIRHVTKPGANLFRELGFPAGEAARLQRASQRQINDIKALKKQLMSELSKWIVENDLKQSDAAEVLMVSRPRVSDVVNLKTGKFTIGALVRHYAGTGAYQTRQGHRDQPTALS